MKLKTLLVSAVALLCSAGAWAQGWVSSPVAEGDFYLYNVGAAGYLYYGARWGKHAVISNDGQKVTLTLNDGNYTIYTGIGDGKYFNNNGYMDGASAAWTFVAVGEHENTYKIKSGDNYVYVEEGLHNVMVGSDPGDSRAYWKLVTSSNRTSFTTASASNPQDVTFLFDSPNFNYGTTGWNDALTLGGNLNPAYNDWNKQGANDEASWNNHNPNVESFDSNSFDMYQSKTGLINGFYLVTCQGFYRAGDGGTTAMTQNALLYANTAESPLMNINSGAKAYTAWQYTRQVGSTDKYVPDAQYQVSNVFSLGDYSDNSVEVNVTDGSLKIGVKKSAAIEKDWTIFDNFHVYYLGNPKADLTTLQGTIDASYLNNATYANVGGSERTALTEAKTLTAASETAEAYEAAISTVQAVIDAFVAAADNYDALAAINAKIEAIGTLPYALSAKKPSAHEGTSSSDAASFATSLITALRTYVESNGLGEGVDATNYTDRMTNNICPGPKTADDKAYSTADGWNLSYVRFDGGEGWMGSSTSHDVYYGSNGYFWGNFSGSRNSSMQQVISDLPVGKYLLTVRARSSGTVPTLYISGNGMQQDITNPNGVFGNGWDDTSVLFTVGANKEAIIRLQAQKESDGTMYRWYNADNFRLVRIDDLDGVTIAETETSAPATTTDYKNVTLTRTLNNSYWNTFCSPIDIDATNIVSTFGDGTLITEFDTDASIDNNTLTFKSADAIEAGKPYLIKPANTTANPTFSGVKVTATSGQTITNGSFKFIGVIAQTELAPNGDGGSINYFVNTSNEVVKLSEAGNLKGMRAYFNAPASASPVKMYIDGIETSIGQIDNEQSTMDKASIYNLAGQRLSKAQKGVNIINGKKVLVK